MREVLLNPIDRSLFLIFDFSEYDLYVILFNLIRICITTEQNIGNYKVSQREENKTSRFFNQIIPLANVKWNSLFAFMLDTS